MARMSTTPIADYALLSDRHSAALVSRAGSIDWLCFPRFDSPSVFGRLLDDDAGHWSISVPNATEVTRRYLDRTMVLQTTFRTPTGEDHAHRRLGHGRGQSRASARARCAARPAAARDLSRGQVDVQFEYAVRPEYGLARPELEVVDDGVIATAGADVLVLSVGDAARRH